MYLVVEFTADDGGYSSSASLLQQDAAESACEEWCRENEVVHTGLKDYEVEDDNGFFYSFSVKAALIGTSISTGQWR